MPQRLQLNPNIPAETHIRLRPLTACIRALIAGGLFVGTVTPPSNAALPVPYTLPVPLPGPAFVSSGNAFIDPKVTGKAMRIEQRSDKAILNWQKFDVGKGYSVRFAQPSSSSITLNRIHEESNPSHILGTVTANGQLYLVNKNGFVFHDSAVVNTGALVASALNISDDAFNKGIIRVFDLNRNQQGLDQAALNGRPDGSYKGVKPNAQINVSAGAKINAGKNGNIILAAPTVSNSGSISADEKGQILLVASKDKVYLQPASSDSPFAGLLVEVETGGKVSNGVGGEISTRLGNISLAGFAVNQNGKIKATTSVNVNGSVRLLAREKFTDALEGVTNKLRATRTDRITNLDGLGKESTVTFGKGSSVEILADANGGSAIDEQAQKQSYIDVSANKIHMESGSSIVAPFGKVSLTATNRLDNPIVGTDGRIYLERGSQIDVSGVKNVKVPMARNVAEVSVQSFNLRDAPFQRGGILQGKTVRVDIRKNTEILDASGGSASIKRGIDERLGKGGEINLTSSGDVVVNSGAMANISGGSVSYQDGFVNTTKLLSSVGRLVDISDADPDELYIRIFGFVTRLHDKWGVTERWNVLGNLGLGHFERGYTDGQAAGSHNIQSPLISWNGQVIAGSVSSVYQRSKPVSDGLFSINEIDNADTRVGNFLTSQNVLFQTQQQPLNIVFADPKFPTKADGKAIDLVLSTALVNQSGLSNILIKTSGKFTVANDAAISMPVLSKFNVDAAEIDIIGSIYSAGGTINLNGVNTGAADSGKIKLADTSVLDVSGRWVNDFQKGLTAILNEPAIINGGTVALHAISELNFNKGAAIKADGGAWQGSDGIKLTAGKAGDIELAAGNSTIPGLLHLNGALSAYGLYDGGHLSLSSNKINVGANVNESNALNLGVSNGSFDFAPVFGFSSLTLKSNLNDITVKSGTDLNLMTQNRVLTGNQASSKSMASYSASGQRIPKNYQGQASSKSIAGFSQLMVLPEHLRKPVTLGLEGATGVTLETSSSIRADKDSTVNISSGNLGKGIYIDGLIDTPAGNINLALNVSEADVAYNPSQSIWLGSHAFLTTHGTTRLNPVDGLGRASGDVLSGGDVTVNAERGYVVFEQGSKVDVSGNSVRLDLPVANAVDSVVRYAKRNIGSDAGKISISAAEGVVLDGSLNAKAGSSSNRGGRLDLTLDRNQRIDQSGGFPTNALHIDLMQHDQKSLATNTQFGSVIPDSLNGRAALSSDEVAQAGFDDLHLVLPYLGSTQKPAGEVRFMGDVNLSTSSSINIDAQTTKWEGLNGSLTGNVNLNTGYLQLGSSTVGDVIGASTIGGGKLTTNAMWTQLTGASLLTGFNRVNLNSSHDLRAVGFRLSGTTPVIRKFTGNLNTAADLDLSASQIYPSTLSDYTFSVTSPSGKLTVSGRNTDTTPLSAAGKLVFNAPVIEQNGVLKAPLGTIELNATTSLSFGEGSLTSVSADGKTIPLGVIANNVWKYPLENLASLVFNEKPGNTPLGEKHLVFKSPDIEFKTGSIVDVSGGGDLLAYEFQPGLGGSFDYLDPNSNSYQGGFAILPSLGSSLAPYDHNMSANFAPDPRAQVYLDGTNTLPAGKYTILPARYALLPGAYLVTPQADTQDQITTSHTKSGLPIVSGFQTLAGTNTRDSRRGGYLIETSAEVKKHSEYNTPTANNFFAQRAASKETAVPLLPIDSGQISIDANTKLILDGQFKVAAKNGRGAKMDISADNIKVVKHLGTGSTGTLELLDRQLSKLRIDSLLLGGTRQFDHVTGNTNLTVRANNVTFEQGSHVQALDLVAAGKDSVEVKNGARINSSGTVNTGESVINVTGDSALLRVSADKQITVNRSYPSGFLQGSTGDLLVEQGAVLSASKSMLLDASKSTILNGDIAMKGGALSLTANTINIGEITGQQGNSLNLSNQKLTSFSVDDLVLNSRGSINFYGNVGLNTNGTLAPIQFNRLILDAQALSGYENTGKAARLKANSVQVQNSSGSSATQSGTGSGTLDLIATNYSQGSGAFGLDGFNTANINVAKQFTSTGNSAMKIASDLNLIAGSITTTGGHKLEIDATGHNVVISGNGSPNQSVSNDFGGSVFVNANNVTLNNANVLLPSGTLKLQARTGDILVNGKTDIKLAGRAVSFADIFDYTPGGTFSADAKLGKILLSADSSVDVSTGGGTAAGGNLIFKASEKTLDLLGSIKAAGASAVIDVANYSPTASFDSLMNKLMTAGVSDALYFRTHNADIVQAAGNVIKANSLTLVADKGAIDLSGVLNANGSKGGGDINLYAGGKIALENGALLTAKGAEKGGKVLLSSTDSLVTDLSGIEIKSGSTIDVSGSSANTGGEVTLSALRTADGTNVNIKPIAGTVQGYNQFYAEGIKKYNNLDANGVVISSVINSSNIDAINQDTVDYMAAAAQNVANTLGGGIRLRPGVEIDYTGDLSLSNAWDFANQRFGQNSDTPGSLIVTASGNLNLNNSITDGFQGGVLQTGDSWSFQLVSGADQTSADKFATSAATDLTLGSNVSIHTGSGDIKLASGGSINLTDRTSTVYTAGRADLNNRYGTLDGLQLLDYSLPQEPFLTTEFLNGEYPINGGDIIIRAGADIKGAISNQFINQWLVRQGARDSALADLNHLTAWAIDASQFQQNIGSFGGGKVNIAASGNINDLSVMMPTTGKQKGLNMEQNSVEVQGGGQMQVKAGGDIAGGAYFLGRGDGVISAGGEIKGSANQFKQGPQIVMSGDQSDSAKGNTKLTLNANQRIKIAAASDAMVLNPNNTVFFTYPEKGVLALKSLSGDVHLNADTSVISQILGITHPDNQLLAEVYPASLDVTAFNGSVKLDKDIVLFPSAVSNLNILAKQDISSRDGLGSKSIIMSDADPVLLPKVSSPIAASISDPNLIDVGKKFNPDNIIASLPAVSKLIHAPIPVHSADKQPARLVTQVGDISSVKINLPKRAIIQARRDLKNLSLQIQHSNPSDASIISSGRDITFETGLDSNGLLDRSQNANKIEIAGPGDALVKTGRNLDLGSSTGLPTVGNLFNPNLPSGGASLDVLVGLNGGIPDYAAFISKYQTKPLYAEKFMSAKSVITEFMRQRSGDTALSVEDAFTVFRNLKGDETLPVQAQLNAHLAQVFFNELKIAGSASAADKSVGNKGGFAAIDTLFPGNHWKGDLNIFFSKIHTIAGGDINLFVPGGKVNAGLAVAPGGAGSKKADELGIVAQNEGQINAFVKDDFIVNTSRVFTLGGGDLLIWSSEGDIDAGKGAKSALSVTVEPPFFNDKGVLEIPAPKITNGSGIRTASSGQSSGDVSSERRRKLMVDTTPEKPGDVYLIAPNGVIDAGEAGIAGNNVTLSATAVLGANNIQVGGVATGVPTPPPSAAAGLTGTSNLSAGVSQAAEASVAANNERNSQIRDAVLGLVTVDILGFGE
jgi:filamentous hemagglutinin